MPNNALTFQDNRKRNTEAGNIVFFILLAIVLIGLVTAAIRSTGDGANIDKESLTIRVAQIRQYANELERGVGFIMQDGASEVDVRFAHPNAPADYGVITNNPTRQVFGISGGGAEYRLPFTDISTAANWEFYGRTHMPDVGTGAPELIAVLPNVTRAFCNKINEINGFTPGTQPLDNTGDCLNAGAVHRFSSSNLYATGGSIDTTNEATFTAKPSLQGCVECAGDYHFFHVLMTR